MLKYLISDIKLHKKEIWLLPTIIFACFLIGFLLLCTVTFTVDDVETWFPMGTLIALIGLALFSVMCFYRYYQEFMLSLSMGRTRTEFMVSYALRMLLLQVFGYGMVLIIYRLELAVGSRLFAAWPLEVEFSFLAQWWFVALLPVIVVFTMFLGALYSYFGKKVLAPMWFIWMAGCMLVPRLFHEENLWILRLMPSAAWIILGIVLVIGMAVTVVILGTKQMVK